MNKKSPLSRLKKQQKDEIPDPEGAGLPFDPAFVPPLLERPACTEGRPTSCVTHCGCLVELDVLSTRELLESGHSAH